MPSFNCWRTVAGSRLPLYIGDPGVDTPYTVLGLSRCALEMIGPRSGSFARPCWKNIEA